MAIFLSNKKKDLKYFLNKNESIHDHFPSLHKSPLKLKKTYWKHVLDIIKKITSLFFFLLLTKLKFIHWRIITEIKKKKRTASRVCLNKKGKKKRLITIALLIVSPFHPSLPTPKFHKWNISRIQKYEGERLISVVSVRGESARKALRVFWTREPK